MTLPLMISAKAGCERAGKITHYEKNDIQPISSYSSTGVFLPHSVVIQASDKTAKINLVLYISVLSMNNFISADIRLIGGSIHLKQTCYL